MPVLLSVHWSSLIFLLVLLMMFSMPMAPSGPRHERHILRLDELLRAFLDKDSHIRTQMTLRVGSRLLEPDLVVVRGTIDEYADEPPSGDDALLVVEVADSSRSRDEWKAKLYSEAGVEVYWIIDLREGRLVEHRLPNGSTYASVRHVDRADMVTLPWTAMPLPLDAILASTRQMGE